MTLPDPAPVLQLIDAFRHSKTMFTAVALGVFERLHERPASAAELAPVLSANPDATGRLLDACAALGLLRKQDGVFTNEPVAEAYLVSSSPNSLLGYIRYSDEALYKAWGNLADAVREGTPRWKQTFGLEGGIFDAFFRTEPAMRDFLRGMHGFGMISSPRVVEAFDLGRFSKFVDLGGATGHLAIAACRRYPGLRAVVFDLPRVAASARAHIAESAMEERVEVIAGDFFHDELPAADLYAVGRILHDWDDDTVIELARRIYAALPENGALLVAEKLLAEDGVGPLPANMQSLNMLVVTEGRERSLSQFDALLRRAGFAQVEGRRTGVTLDALLAVKITS